MTNSGLVQEEKELRLLIDSIKNVLTDVPYKFMYDGEDDKFIDEFNTEEFDDEDEDEDEFDCD